MELPVLISFSLYMTLMVGIGFYFYFKTDDLSDYVLGGRGLGPGVTALSAGASDMSGWLLLGLPGMMYSQGLVGSWIAVGLIIGSYLNWHYVAKPLRVYTHHLNDSITIPDYFSNRFEEKGHSIRLVTAIVILVFYTLYTSSGLVGGAKLFEATFGLDYTDALLIGSVIIVSYTFLGGYNAVSWTDFIQGILMMLALVVTPIVVIVNIGGINEAISIIGQVKEANGVSLQDPEKVFIVLSQLAFNPWIAGFLLAAILAAIMSTVDSQLLVSSSVLTRDIYHAIIKKDASDKELVWIGRSTVIIIALIALYISTDRNSSVLELVSYAWAGFGAAFGPLVILSLYHRGITKEGAIAGMVTGALTVIVYKQLEGGLFDLFELLPGFIVSWLAIVVVSRFTTESESSKITFDEVHEKLKN
jgi:Na+/proline symporter